MKKRLAQNLLFFAINFFGSIYIFVLDSHFYLPGLKIMPVLIFSAVFVLIGSFLGLCIYLWREKEAAKTISYTIGLTVSTIGLFSLLVFMLFFNNPPPKSNAEQNRSDISFAYKGQHEKEAMIAYKALAKKFKDENDILLNGGSYIEKDSMLDGYSQPFYIYRLKYFIRRGATLYVSKIMVHDTMPEFIFFNRVAVNDAETREHDSASRHYFFKSPEGTKSVTKVDSFPAQQ